MTFHVGQKVVCVFGDWSDDWTNHDSGTPLLPEKGKVYIVRGVRKWWFADAGLQPAIYLMEIINPEWGWEQPGEKVGEHPFYAGNFRPLIERSTETGMAVLKEILRTVGDRTRVSKPAGGCLNYG